MSQLYRLEGLGSYHAHNNHFDSIFRRNFGDAHYEIGNRSELILAIDDH
jgi:hypothetical protein